jgi:hypothetical protein
LNLEVTRDGTGRDTQRLQESHTGFFPELVPCKMHHADVAVRISISNGQAGMNPSNYPSYEGDDMPLLSVDMHVDQQQGASGSARVKIWRFILCSRRPVTISLSHNACMQGLKFFS